MGKGGYKITDQAAMYFLSFAEIETTFKNVQSETAKDF
jgi:hypothetical protein